FPIDPNSASKERLTELPGVGPALADRIIDGRTYDTLDDLQRVSGIGPSFLDRLKPMLTLSESKQAEVSEGPEPSESLPEVEAPEMDMAIEADEDAIPEPITEATSDEEVSAEYPTEAEPEGDKTAEPEQEGPSDDLALQSGEVLESEPQPEELSAPVEELEEVEEVDEVEKVETKTADKAPVPPPEPTHRAPSCGSTLLTVLAVSVFSILLAVIISLGIMAALNAGQLQFVRFQQYNEMSLQISSLEEGVRLLQDDVDNLRKRVDNLEALGDRVNSVETSVQDLESDLAQSK
ncbi:unnamed protein product, partial [marine sediment metagenome]